MYPLTISDNFIMFPLLRLSLWQSPWPCKWNANCSPINKIRCYSIFGNIHIFNFNFLWRYFPATVIIILGILILKKREWKKPTNTEKRSENSEGDFISKTRPERRNKFPDILGGITFICAGLILLLNNFGVISWSIWSYLINFWPIVFILIGLDLVVGNSLIIKLITTLIGVAIIFFVIVYSLTAADYNFRSYIFNNYPTWKKIYQSIPSSPNNSRGLVPNNFHFPLDSGYYYSN